jgi:hypothetical protein
MYSQNSHPRILHVHSLYEPKIEVQLLISINWFSRPKQERGLAGKSVGLNCKNQRKDLLKETREDDDEYYRSIHCSCTRRDKITETRLPTAAPGVEGFVENVV